MGEIINIGNDGKLSGYIAKPNGEAKAAIIVIHEVWGLNDHTKTIADRLAAEGLIALAPDLLGNALDLPKLRELQDSIHDPVKRTAVQPIMRQLMAPIQSPEFAKTTTDSLLEMFDYLYLLPESKQKVAVMGFCFGGTYSFNLSVAEPRLSAALAFYGHSDQNIDELKKIKCPVMAFYGEQDERLMDGLDDLKERMQKAEVDFTYKVYPDCGHAFFNDSNPHSYNHAAAEDSWQIVLDKLNNI
jgi:carboxymethylenebutenolidase